MHPLRVALTKLESSYSVLKIKDAKPQEAWKLVTQKVQDHVVVMMEIHQSEGRNPEFLSIVNEQELRMRQDFQNQIFPIIAQVGNPLLAVSFVIFSGATGILHAFRTVNAKAMPQVSPGNQKTPKLNNFSEELNQLTRGSTVPPYSVEVAFMKMGAFAKTLVSKERGMLGMPDIETTVTEVQKQIDSAITDFTTRHSSTNAQFATSLCSGLLTVAHWGVIVTLKEFFTSNFLSYGSPSDN